VGISSYPRTPRLVNRFSLGTDPEFSFHTNEGAYIHAEDCGLTTLHAFGCDMSGRQAEIRAYPSKFALEVVASIVDSLRWMACAHGQRVLPLKWVAMGYNGKDGCGGHIHFGRRRPNRDREVETLDGVTKTLLDLKVLDPLSFHSRQRDGHNFGQYGDIRLQSHGFEYRTLSTGLASPWLTYFVLVINKLVLYKSDLWRPPEWLAQEYIINLLKEFQYVDDDAAIALRAVQVHGLPKEDGKDIKSCWGIDTAAKSVLGSKECSTRFFPSATRPEELTRLELFEHLTKGTPLPKRVPVPTWEPIEIPKDFFTIKVKTHTLGHLPDIGKDLISYKAEVSLNCAQADRISILHNVPLPIKKIREVLEDLGEGVAFDTKVSKYQNNYRCIQITVPFVLNKSLERCKRLHRILSDSSLFPVCRGELYNSIDWSRWGDLEFPTKPSLGRVVTRVKGKLSPVRDKRIHEIRNEDIVYYDDLGEGGNI
jgi:hypothetical protein